MSSEKAWPKWLKIAYYKLGSESIQSYLGSVTDARMLYEVFNRLELKMEQIIALEVNETIQSDTNIQQMFQWIDKYKKEMEEREKRQTSN
ncbi:hypothetical protein [Mesobacillus thioparans]|uniref:hypothetical protein n=1 Tax=Mesobacillus thioparans TaxID=370439 RepID=UPI0039EE35CF